MDFLKTILSYSETFVYILSFLFVASIGVSFFLSRLFGLMMMMISLTLLPWAVVGWHLRDYLNFDPDLIDRLPDLVSEVDEVRRGLNKIKQ